MDVCMYICVRVCVRVFGRCVHAIAMRCPCFGLVSLQMEACCNGGEKQVHAWVMKGTKEAEDIAPRSLCTSFQVFMDQHYSDIDPNSAPHQHQQWQQKMIRLSRSLPLSHSLSLSHHYLSFKSLSLFVITVSLYIWLFLPVPVYNWHSYGTHI